MFVQALAYMLSDSLLYSIKNLKSRKLRTFLTMLGIIIGIASVVALIGLGNGLREGVLSQFGSVSADILTIQAGGIQGGGPPGTGVVNPLKKKDVDAISRLPGIDFAAGRIVKSAKVEFNQLQTIGFVASLPDGEARRKVEEIQGFTASEGRLLKDGDKNKAALGSNYALQDNSFGRAVHTGDRILINGKSFEVVGILKKKGSFIFDNVIWLNEDILRELLDIKDDENIIVARAKSLDSVDAAKAAIEKYLRRERDVKVGEEDFTVQTAQAMLQSVNSVLGGIQAFVIIVASISMIVGAIGIVNTMFTAVLERRKEIGIMKAIGAKNRDIFILFFIESGLLGLLGGILGAAIGSGLAFAGTAVMDSALGLGSKPGIGIMLISLALLGSFLIGSLAGIVPAMRAANLQPVDALRGG